MRGPSAFLIALALFLAAPLGRAAGGDAPIRHVVFDLDWTLLSPLREKVRGATGERIARGDPARVIEAMGERFRIADGAEELITRLANEPGVRVSFFSGGSPERNRAALQRIVLTDGSGRTAWDVAYRALSKDDLTDLAAGQGPVPERFALRYKKDLLKITPDLENVILIDDTLEFARPGQERNLRWLGRVYGHYETLEEARAARETLSDLTYVPPSREAWLADRDKLRRAGEVIDEALRRARERGMGLVAALHETELSWGACGREVRGLIESLVDGAATPSASGAARR